MNWHAPAKRLALGSQLARAIWHETADGVLFPSIYCSLKCFPAPKTFLEDGIRRALQRVTHTVFVPTMINLLIQFPEVGKYDLKSLAVLAYGGSPIAPELIRRTRDLLPKVKLVQVYGLSETGFLTGLQDDEHVEGRLLSCGRPCPGIDVQVVDESGKQVGAGKPGELVARGANVMRGYWKNPEETAHAF